MLIGELSKLTGLSRDTIRFYEKENLIAPEKTGRKVMSTNTYKNYPPSVATLLRFIQRTKVLGFTLAEIKGMMALRDLGPNAGKKWVSEAEAKLRVIDRKIAELHELKKLMGTALARCSDQCFDNGCEVLDGAVAKSAGSAPRPVQGNHTSNPGDCRSDQFEPVRNFPIDMPSP